MAVQPEKTETLVGMAILALLVVIAAGILMRQSRYDPQWFTMSRSEHEIPQAAGELSHLQELLPDGWVPLTPLETFSPENLSDKINGKAELYLAAGFQKLESQRFKRSDQDDSWLELFVFDMGSTRNAFAVFSTQRRTGSTPVDLTRHAYQTENALFFVHGRDYVEVIAAEEGLADEMLAIGRNFVERKPVQSDELSEQSLFPRKNLNAESIALLASDAFGFSRLNNIFTAKYNIAGQEMRAFLSVRPSGADAQQLAEAYHAFLLENGGSDVDSGTNLPEIKLIEIFDLYELIFVHGRVLAGVHEAESKDAALELGLTLYRELQEVDESQ
ncbi:DUF6599 family protein [Desulfoferrobacter suflitae]|uniref:DUF6599 family protein n=1 Tax=Desulfoferrobacter suflitae TaxID=2865782 RepID=UPI00216425DF|nr:DUF6599 family protein [Desulfoferrobacter suflitae]MCK8600848.1 hypothetical protein [Desulfoferrobacter suflitae]